MPITVTQEGDRWVFQFDQPEARGTVVVQPGVYGLEISIPEVGEEPLALVDLYYLSTCGQPADGAAVPGLVIYSPQTVGGDTLGYVRYYPAPRGTRVEFEPGVQAFERERGTEYGLE